jgi:hypothetical protein
VSSAELSTALAEPVRLDDYRHSKAVARKIRRDQLEDRRFRGSVNIRIDDAMDWPGPCYSVSDSKLGTPWVNIIQSYTHVSLHAPTHPSCCGAESCILLVLWTRQRSVSGFLVETQLRGPDPWVLEPKGLSGLNLLPTWSTGCCLLGARNPINCRLVPGPTTATATK